MNYFYKGQGKEAKKMGSFRLPVPSSQILIFLQLWKDAKGVWLSSSPWENVKMSCLEGSWVQVVFPSVLLTWMSRASSLTSVRLKIFISKIETLHLPAWAQNGLIWIGCISVHITKLWGMGWVVFQIAINCFWNQPQVVNLSEPYFPLLAACLLYLHSRHNKSESKISSPS